MGILVTNHSGDMTEHGDVYTNNVMGIYIYNVYIIIYTRNGPNGFAIWACLKMGNILPVINQWIEWENIF